MEPNPPWSFWDWLFVIGAAMAGVAARLSHTYAKRQEAAEALGVPARGISRGETIAALIGAPALGMIAGSFAIWRGIDTGIALGMAGFAGLAGPAALLAIWDKVFEPLATWIKPKGS